MREKKAKAFWIGILLIYVIAVSTAIILDIALHWGLIAGLKILAVIHILLVFFVVTSIAAKRKQDWNNPNYRPIPRTPYLFSVTNCVNRCSSASENDFSRFQKFNRSLRSASPRSGWRRTRLRLGLVIYSLWSIRHYGPTQCRPCSGHVFELRYLWHEFAIYEWQSWLTIPKEYTFYLLLIVKISGNYGC